MDLRHFRTVNVKRCESEQCFNHLLNSWSLSDWFTAVLGELGEAANIAKKLKRIKDNIPGNKPDETEANLKDRLAKELADSFIYLDLLAASEHISLSYEVVKVFNKKSRDIGCSIVYSYDEPVTREWWETFPGVREDNLSDTHVLQVTSIHRLMWSRLHKCIELVGHDILLKTPADVLNFISIAKDSV